MHAVQDFSTRAITSDVGGSVDSGNEKLSSVYQPGFRGKLVTGSARNRGINEHFEIPLKKKNSKCQKKPVRN